MIKIRKILSRPFVLYIISLAVMAGFFALSFQRLPPRVPLFFSLPFGNDQIVLVQFIFLLPVLSFLSILFNNIVSRYILEDSEFVNNVTGVVNMTVVVTYAYIFIKILHLIAW